MTTFIKILSVLLSLQFLNLNIAAHAQDKPVKRKILALYDGRYYHESSETLIHKFAEMPLNYMGLDVHYHDINKGLPDIKTLSDYRGIITWFGRYLEKPNAYMNWANKAMKAGLKFALFSELGVEPTPKNEEALNRFLSHLGIRVKEKFIKDSRGTTVYKLNKDMIGFERKIYSVFPSYNLFQTTSAKTKVHLSVKKPIKYRGGEAVLVTTNKNGGFVHSGFAIYYDNSLEINNWILNPFHFFQQVFGQDIIPIPDVTTLVGRRIYFSHIDGDGWHNISYIERYRRKKDIAAKVVLKEFIEPYPDLPVTVALLTGDCDDSIGGNAKGCDVARQMYALPQVEVGSHTHTHPFKWSFFKNYNRQKELALIKKYQPQSQEGIRARLVKLMAQFTGKLSSREKNKRYIAGSSKLPRAFLKKPYNLKNEIADSLAIAQSYAPKGKKAMLLQWSGDTDPSAVHIKAVRDAGAFNLNGGDTRLDSHFPSVSYVTGISRVTEGERQIYAANSNENTYTNDWTGPFYGFMLLSQTVENTELPRRLKPFSIYYHSYSGERAAALNAIQTHLNTARNGKYVPIAASLYSRIAGGFFSTKFKKIKTLKWSVHNRGALQTLRFGKAKALFVNWQDSKGILGSTRHAGSLYIALDPAIATPIISLSKTASKQPKRTLPVLSDSRWQISGLKGEKCAFRFSAEGYGQGDMTWRNMKPSQIYKVSARRDGRILWQDQITADQNGILPIKTKAGAIKPVSMQLSCLVEATSVPEAPQP